METDVKNDPVIAIAGVTGAVGAEFIAVMNKRRFPVGKLKALASARSAGKTLDFRGDRIVIEQLNEGSFDGVDIALFSAGSGVSRKFTPIAVKAGAVVIDNSSAFRMDPNVPLVIPEINGNRIREHKGIIAVPNCSAITALVPLWPIHRQNRIRRVIHGRTGGVDPRPPQRTGLSADRNAAPLRVQCVQPRHRC
jgi:aspartate-semialdehyde dehydrogenase